MQNASIRQVEISFCKKYEGDILSFAKYSKSDPTIINGKKYQEWDEKCYNSRVKLLDKSATYVALSFIIEIVSLIAFAIFESAFMGFLALGSLGFLLYNLVDHNKRSEKFGIQAVIKARREMIDLGVSTRESSKKYNKSKYAQYSDTIEKIGMDRFAKIALKSLQEPSKLIETLVHDEQNEFDEKEKTEQRNASELAKERVRHEAEVAAKAKAAAAAAAPAPAAPAPAPAAVAPAAAAAPVASSAAVAPVIPVSAPAATPVAAAPAASVPPVVSSGATTT